MGPAFREVGKPRSRFSPAVLVRVVIGAVRLSAGQSMLAFLELKEVRVVLLLLPPMGCLTHVLQLAPIHVSSNELLGLPATAHFRLVLENRGLASVVLPVVGVYTGLPIMRVVVSVGAPHSFEVVEIKVHVYVVVFN
jgi:hypothetical protein